MANEGNLKPWKPGQSGNPNGRPKKTFRIINDKLKEQGGEELTKGQLIEAYGLIFNATEEELKEIASDPNTPMAMRIIILDLSDREKRTQALKDYRDYIFGRATSKQVIEAGENTKVIVDFRKE